MRRGRRTPVQHEWTGCPCAVWNVRRLCDPLLSNREHVLDCDERRDRGRAREADRPVSRRSQDL